MPKAGVVILMNALYSVADSLCSVFVSVYFYINSMDVTLVFQHYVTLYIATPIAFIFAGWYAKTRDRTYVFRIGRDTACHLLCPVALLAGGVLSTT